jgi:hypothetical protein
VFKRRNLMASLDGLEIGATAPKQLQFVLNAEGRTITVRLTAEEARFLAQALTYWAESSESIGVQ